MIQQFKKQIYFIAFIIYLFGLSGCKNHKIKFDDIKDVFRFSNYKIKLKDLKYKLEIDNVECKICAKKVLKILESIYGVLKAEFVLLKNNFDNSFVLLYVKNKNVNLDLDTINEQLKQEGFSLKNIEGEFVGTFYRRNSIEYFQPLISKEIMKIKSKNPIDCAFGHTLFKGKIHFGETNIFQID